MVRAVAEEPGLTENVVRAIKTGVTIASSLQGRDDHAVTDSSTTLSWTASAYRHR